MSNYTHSIGDIVYLTDAGWELYQEWRSMYNDGEQGRPPDVKRRHGFKVCDMANGKYRVTVAGEINVGMFKESDLTTNMPI